MTRRLVLILPVLVVLTAAAPAGAHGILKRASPPPGTSVDAPPKTVTLVFNEPVDRVYSSATVVDASGRSISGRAVVSADGLTMTVPLNAGAGIFTVRWHVLSQLDGHTTNGRFRFAVRAARLPGQVQTPSADVQAPAEDLTVTGASIDFPRALVRWIGIAAVLLAAGTAFFTWLVIGPLDSEAPAAVSRHQIEHALRPIAVGSAVIMALAAIGEFLIQAAALLDLPFSRLPASGMLGGLLVDTKAGWSTLARMILAVAFLVPPTPRGRVFRMSFVIWFAVVAIVFALLSNPGVVTGSRHFEHFVALLLVATVYGLITAVGALILPMVPDLKLPEGAWAPPVAGIMVVGALTVSSHAAGRGPVAAVVDWVHLVAAAAWIGGLVPLGVILLRTSGSDRSDLARRIVPRFSQISGWSLGVLVVTGTFGAWLHIPALRAFVETLYGRTLLIKLLLVLPVVALGAINRFVLRPRIARGADGHTRRGFIRNLSGEVVLAAGILLAVAVLTITPPASVSLPAAAEPSVRLSGFAGGLRVTLTVSPGQPGVNQFAVEVDPSLSVESVEVVLMELGALREPSTIMLAFQGTNRYAAETEVFDRAGIWKVDVVLRRRDSSTTVVTFPLLGGTAAARETDSRALRLLEQTRSALSAIRSWKTVEQITDGAGNVVVTVFEAAQPDRLRYRTSTDVEGVVIGSRRYQRQSGGAWEQDRMTTPLVVRGPFAPYLEQVEAAAMGRTDRCGRENCQVVLWDAPGRAASFAGWIGLRTLRVHRLLMVAPAHFMTAELLGVILSKSITPP